MFLRLKKLWLRLNHALGFVLSSILLAVLWVTLFAVYAIALNIIRFFRHPRSAGTYWIDVSENDQRNMCRQF